MDIGLRCNFVRSKFTWVTRLLVACITMATTTPTHAATVASLSGDKLVQQGSNTYWQAVVKCEGNSAEFRIKQEGQQVEWCSENTLLPCELTKLGMAEQVCLNIDVLDSSSQIAAPEPIPDRNETNQQESQQQARQRQEQAELASAIRAEEANLQKERRSLEAEKRLVEQADRELSLQEQQLETQLRELQN